SPPPARPPMPTPANVCRPISDRPSPHRTPDAPPGPRPSAARRCARTGRGRPAVPTAPTPPAECCAPIGGNTRAPTRYRHSYGDGQGDGRKQRCVVRETRQRHPAEAPRTPTAHPRATRERPCTDQTAQAHLAVPRRDCRPRAHLRRGVAARL